MSRAELEKLDAEVFRKSMRRRASLWKARCQKPRQRSLRLRGERETSHAATMTFGEALLAAIDELGSRTNVSRAV